ncbi:MAG TPA: nuclear transport factor 2 family protein [Gemmatimonadaceae bacterium]
MSRYHSLMMAAVAMLSVGCTAKKSDDGPPPVASGPSDAFLDSNLTAFLNAMKTKDPAPAMAAWADNAISYSPNMAPIRGKPAIEQYNKEWFASVAPDSIAAGRDGLLSSGDLAVETGWYYFKGKMFGQPAVDSGRYINVWQRQPDGSWKIVRDMANSMLPMPGVQDAGTTKK